MFVNANQSRPTPIVQDSEGIGAAEQHAEAEPKITAEYFSNAYQRGFHSTVRFLLSRGVSPEAALDTAQAAWTKGWERREQLRQPNLVLTWTNTIALNIYRSVLRRERQTEPLGEVEASTSLNVAVIDVERLLKRCQPSDRIVMEEHYIDGYKATEIAQKRGCSETAVRIRLYRARRKIQSHLARAGVSRPILGLAASLGRAECDPEERRLDDRP